MFCKFPGCMVQPRKGQGPPGYCSKPEHWPRQVAAPPPPSGSVMQKIDLGPRGAETTRTIRENEKRDPRRFFTPKQRRETISRDGHMCVSCGATDKKLEMDHIHPWSRGGRTVIENAQLLCQDCNQEKSDEVYD